MHLTRRPCMFTVFAQSEAEMVWLRVKMIRLVDVCVSCGGVGSNGSGAIPRCTERNMTYGLKWIVGHWHGFI